MLPRINDTAPNFTAQTTDEDAKVLFPAGWKTVKPYLRAVVQPR
jgi:hypothetical protein